MADQWTLKECDIIERHYMDMTARQLVQAYFPHRSIKAIQGQAHKLGVHKWHSRPWSRKEVELLTRVYHFGRAQISHLFPERTLRSITKKAVSLGIADVNVTWEESEIAILRHAYSLGGAEDAALVLPWRTQDAIIQKAHQLGMRRARKVGDGKPFPWSKEEILVISENLELPPKDLVKLLPSRSRVAVKEYRNRIIRNRYCK